MTSFNDPATDLVLLGLKKVALSGKGGKGPFFDQGVLAVIKQIESNGSFIPDPSRLMWGVHSAVQLVANVLTSEEISRATQMAQQRGWTLEQGAQYGAGVRDAEELLSYYRKESA